MSFFVPGTGDRQLGIHDEQNRHGSCLPGTYSPIVPKSLQQPTEPYIMGFN